MTNPQFPGNPSLQEMYGPEYYDRNLGSQAYDQKYSVWRNHFRTLAETIVERYHPKRVLDVGCAKGFLVEHLRNCGVEAFGIDASEYAISRVSPAARPYCKVASGDGPISEKYDLITCIEVAEHVPAAVGTRMIHNICNAAQEVIFSSTPSDFNDDTHLNIKTASGWDRAFAEHQYYPDLHFDPLFITPHARHYKKLARPVRVAVFSNEPKSFAVVRLRLLNPIQHLEKQGRLQLIFVSKDDPLLPVEELLSCDVFVIQREFANHKLSALIMNAAQALRKPVVFETDDLLNHLPLSNPNYLSCAAIARDLRDTMSKADFVTVSTDRLGEELQKDGFIKKEQTHVLTNCIDTDLWGSAPPREAAHDKHPLVLGWMGTATHDEDLSIVKQAIAYILRKYEGRVVFKTYGYMPAELATVPGAILARGPEHNIQKHAADVRASGIDIAIAPLTDHVFNHAKSHLKWLEYAICGIPGIYSNVTPYSSYISHRYTGLVVENTTEAWAAAMEELIENALLRKTIARNAHEVVLAEHSLETQAWRWDHLYHSIVVSGRRPVPVAVGTGRNDSLQNDDGPPNPERAAAALFADQTNRLLSKGQLELAIRSFEQAVVLEPEFAERGFAFAARLAAQCRDSGALAVYKSILNASKNPVKVLLELAKYYQSFGDSLECEKLLSQIALDPRTRAADVWSYFSFLLAAGRADEAAEVMQTFLSREPSPEEAVLRTNELLTNGHIAFGRELLDGAVQLYPGDGELKSLQKELHQKLAGVAAPLPSKVKMRRTVTLMTGTSLAAPRTRTRAAGILSELQRQGKVTFHATNGEQNKSALRDARVVVVASSCAERPSLQKAIEEIQQSGAAIVTEFDRAPDVDAGEALELLIRSSFAAVVPHADFVAEVGARGAIDQERIFIIPDAVDGGPALRSAHSTRGSRGPLAVGCITNGFESNLVKQLLVEIAERFEKTSGAAILQIYGELPDCLQGRRAVRAVCGSYPTAREWQRIFVTDRCDIAIIPAGQGRGARRECEYQWLQFASLQIPSIVSSRAASPSVLVQGENAILTPDAPSAWIETIASLAQNHTQRDAVAYAAWTDVITKRTTQQMAPRWLELLNWIEAEAPVGIGTVS